MQHSDDVKTQKIGYQPNEKVDWFYKQLAVLYGAGKWSSTFAKTDQLNLSKEQNEHEIDLLTREQVVNGFKLLKKKIQALEKEYLWPDINIALGCCKTGGDSWEHKSDAYREFRPERLLTKETQADRLKMTPKHEAFLKATKGIK